MNKKTAIRFLLRFLIVLAAILSLLTIVFLIMSWNANRPAVPPELLNPPAALAHPLFTPTRDTHVSTSTLSGAPSSSAPTATPLVSSRPIPYSFASAASELAMNLDYKAPAGRSWGEATFNPEVKSGTNVWQPMEPLLPPMPGWLIKNRTLVDQCLLFTESHNSPFPPAENSKHKPASYFDRKWAFSVMDILAAEMMRSHATGDTARASRIAMALVEFTHTLAASDMDWMRRYVGSNIFSIFTWCLENDMWPDDELNTVALELADLHRIIFPPETLAEGVRQEGLEYRQVILKVLNSRWSSDFFVEKYSWESSYFRFDICTKYLFIPNLPRLDFMAPAAFGAMGRARQIKGSGPDVLRQFDRFWPQLMDYARLDFQDMMAHPPLPEPWISRKSDLARHFLPQDRWLRLRDVKAYACSREARLNLVRATLAHRLRQPSAPAADQDLRADRENPWRNPFTNRPFQLAELASSTTIVCPVPQITYRHVAQKPSDAISMRQSILDTLPASYVIRVPRRDKNPPHP